MKQKRVNLCFIGHIGNGEAYDGQTIRTRLLLSEFEKTNLFNIHLVDTSIAYKHRMIFLFKLFFNCILYKRVFLITSDRGTHFIFKFFRFIRIFRRNFIFNSVVGGSFHKNKSKKDIVISSKFIVNWVQTEKLKNELVSLSIKNAEVIPNYRNNEPIFNLGFKLNEGDTFDFCMFSRVSEDKGMTDAIDTIKKINFDFGKKIAHLHIYGRIEEPYKEKFDNLIKENSKFVTYYGAIDQSLAPNELKKYFCLLFPTYWEGEGFPGTVLDAFFAGIPVIASDWNCNSEVVENEINGYIYPNDKMGSLYDAIKYAIENKDEFVAMRKKCNEAAFIYKCKNQIYKMTDLMIKSNKELKERMANFK